MKTNTYYTLITGATSGIGLALAHEFCHNGHNVLLVARSKSKLEKISRELTVKYKVSTDFIEADLSSEEEIKKLLSTVNKRKLKVEILVNNAGFGQGGEFVNLDLDRQQEMINLNIKAVITLSYAFLQKFQAKNRGKILNVASIAGYLPGPYMNVYYATKAFVLSHSIALNKEFQDTGISVSCLCPGATRTNFDQVAEVSDLPLFTISSPMMPETVARAGYKGLMREQDVIVPGLQNKLITWLSGIVPRRYKLTIVKYFQTGKF